MFNYWQWVYNNREPHEMWISQHWEVVLHSRTQEPYIARLLREYKTEIRMAEK